MTRTTTPDGIRVLKGLLDVTTDRIPLMGSIANLITLERAAADIECPPGPKNIFLKYARLEKREIEDRTVVLERSAIPDFAAKMLPSPRQLPATDYSSFVRKEAAVAELTSLALDPRLDSCQRAVLVKEVDVNSQAVLNTLSLILTQKIPNELREAIYEYLIETEARARERLLIAIKEHVTMSDLDAITGRMVCASFNSQNKFIGLAMEDPNSTKGFVEEMAERMTALKKEHDRFHKEERSDSEKILDQDTSPEARDQLVRKLVLELADRTAPVALLGLLQRISRNS